MPKRLVQSMYYSEVRDFSSNFLKFIANLFQENPELCTLRFVKNTKIYLNLSNESNFNI